MRIFEVVDHLNASSALQEDSSEVLQTVRLNVAAARKAMEATAYRAALRYQRAATALLERFGLLDVFWASDYALGLEYCRLRAESEFLEGSQAEAEECVRAAVVRTTSPIDAATVLNTLIVHYTLLARYPEAIAAGRDALAALGVVIPAADATREELEGARDDQIQQVRKALAGRSAVSLRGLPAMTDPIYCTVTKLLIAMGPPCYRAHQRLWAVIVPMVVNLSLRHGHIPQVSYSHTAFGGLVGWVDNDYELAKDFGELAASVMADHFPNPSDQSVFYLMRGSSVRHWFSHLRFGSEDYAEAYEAGLRSGNLQYAAYAFGHDMYCRFFQGTRLPILVDDAKRKLAFSRTRLNRWAIDLLEGGIRVFNGLAGASTAAADKESPRTEADYRKQVEGNHNLQVLCIYNIIRSFSLMVLGEFAEALKVSEEASTLLYTIGTQGLLPWPEHLTTRGVILATLYEGASETQRQTWRTELETTRQHLRHWAHYCRDNFEHKELLISAELARLEVCGAQAALLFGKAAEGARQGGFHHWEAVIHERTAHMWRTMGRADLAQVSLQLAYGCFETWGAQAKLQLIEHDLHQRLCDDLKSIICLCEASPSHGPAHHCVQRSQTCEAIAEQQVELLRRQAYLQEDTRRKASATQNADELSRAAANLRTEIAEHKRAKEALQHSEERFRTIFEQAPLGIALIESLTGRIVEVNARFAQIAGRTRDEMATIDWMSITHPDDVQEDLDNMALLNEGKIPGFNMKKRYIRPDGSVVWIHMTIAPVRVEDERQPRHLCMIEDITATRLAEQEREAMRAQLFQAQRMESIGTLAGGIAHDFNNILAGLMGSLTVLDLGVENNPGFAADVDEMKSMVRRGAELTKQLLGFARRGRYDVRPHDLLAIAEDACNIFRRTRRDVTVSVAGDSDVPAVRTDRTQIEQVLLNLLVNAGDAMPGGGEISVKISTFELSQSAAKGRGAAPGRYVRMEVRDSGTGMDAATRQRIFEPFFTTKEPGKGTGLGLASAYGIVRNHGGYIHMESELGKGSTFFVDLPATEEGVTASTAHRRVLRHGTETILLVDDEDTVLSSNARWLRALGYTVLTARSGREAIDQLEQAPSRVSLVILDMVMPGLGGAQTFSELRKINPGIKVLLASGYSIDGQAAALLAKGCNGFIQKPFDGEALSLKLHELFGTEPVANEVV